MAAQRAQSATGDATGGAASGNGGGSGNGGNVPRGAAVNGTAAVHASLATTTTRYVDVDGVAFDVYN